MHKGELLGFMVFLILLDTPGDINAFGTVDYNDECEFVEFEPTLFTSRLEEWKYCDDNRGLHCVPGLGRCGCIVPLTIYRAGKCRAKVNSGCLIKDYKLDCVEFATCTRNDSSLTFRCRCNRGYLSNAENTACFATETYQRRQRYGNRYGYGDRYGGFYNNGKSTTANAFQTFLPFLTYLCILWN